MEERNYIFSFNEEKCKVGNQKGTLKTFKIEEKLTDGSKVCVIINTADVELYATLRYNGGCTKNILKPHSIITLLF